MAFALEAGRCALGHRVPEQALGRHDDKRLAERAQHLPAQDVEIVGRAGDVAHLDVVVGAQLQEAFEAGAGVFRPLAFEAVRQQHDQAIGAQPLGLAAGDELVDHDLRAVGKVAELRLPQHQRLGIGQGKAVFEAEHAEFGQDRIVDLELAVGQRGQRNVLVLVLLVDPDGVALAEGAAAGILAGKTHVVAFGDKAAEGQRLGRGPVEARAAVEHLLLGVDHALQGLVDGQAFGNRGERAAQAFKQLGVDRGVHVAAGGFGVRRLVQPAPAPGEPVGLVGLVALAGLELRLEQGHEVGADRACVGAVDHAFGFQPRGIDFAYPGVLADPLVHQRLGEARLVTLVVAEAAVAPHVDDDVALELLAVLDRQLAGEGHGLGIITVDVQDRRLDALGDIAGVGG